MICYIKKSYILKTRTGSCKGLEASQRLPWQGGAVTLEASWGHLLCVAYLTAGVCVWPTHYASVRISAKLKVLVNKSVRTRETASKVMVPQGQFKYIMDIQMSNKCINKILWLSTTYSLYWLKFDLFGLDKRDIF